MRDDVPCEFPANYDGAAILARLGQVLDPELDEPILDLGFVRSLRLHSGHASIALRLPTSWCAVNFAFLMAEDVRRALMSVEGISRVTVLLGDHCAAPEIEAAVNDGRPFVEAFPGEAAGSPEALRLTFLRKGFLGRQERLLRELRDAGCSMAAISAELDLDCSPAAPLIVDLEGEPFSAERLQHHYEAIRTVRVALEANGSFCRALLSAQHRTSQPPRCPSGARRGG